MYAHLDSPSQNPRHGAFTTRRIVYGIRIGDIEFDCRIASTRQTRDMTAASRQVRSHLPPRAFRSRLNL
jgi:hypothetical protein